MNEAIGGYFELELRQGEHYHTSALNLSTARNCFEYILRARGYRHIYIPYYTCDVLLEPLEKLSLNYTFYHIDKTLDPVSLPKLGQDEAFLYTNYYGLKQATVERLASQYGSRLIVDNAQAFFAERLIGIDTFYSARKFFGVPDGAYLYTDCMLQDEIKRDYSYDRMMHLLKRVDMSAEDGYLDFQRSEQQLCNQPIRLMSALTHRILSSIDYESAKKKRRACFRAMERVLGTPGCSLTIDENAVPMVFPYWSEDPTLRKRLIEHRIYVATYWPNVMKWTNGNAYENELVDKLIPLPLVDKVSVNQINELI